MYYNMYNNPHHSQDGPVINVEENGSSEAVQSSWLYTQASFSYLLRPESEQVRFSIISFF